MDADMATERDANVKREQLRTARRFVRFARPLLVATMYAALFLPWSDSYSGGNSADSFPDIGFWNWIYLSALLMFVPAIPLATLLPSIIGYTLWPKRLELRSPYFVWSKPSLLMLYRASLLGWLLMFILFVAISTNIPSGCTACWTPHFVLTLVAVALALEVVDHRAASRERALARE